MSSAAITAELTVLEARRLALCRAGLMKPEWTGLTHRVPRSRPSAGHDATIDVVRRFGYLQLDTVSVAGARSHSIVLLSRLAGLHPRAAEELLRPGAPLFEYWGHEASYIPLDLYPAFEFRRRELRDRYAWRTDSGSQYAQVAASLRRRLQEEGPLRSLDMDGPGGRGWWDFKIAKRVANALWSSGELAIRERRNFQRVYDLAERVIPAHVRTGRIATDEAYEMLLMKALDGHGWATTATLAHTWRLRVRDPRVRAAIVRLNACGRIVACRLVPQQSSATSARLARSSSLLGWIRPQDLELAARLGRARPRLDSGVLLSPFDPTLWDRQRVALLFDFDQVLEVFKPAAHRRYGYYCLPVLAGERLVARVDLKAERRAGLLRVLRRHMETADGASAHAAHEAAVDSALARFASALELELASTAAGN